MGRFDHLLPNGFIGGSEDRRFHISSLGARIVIYWGCLFLLIALVSSYVWVARNAESCDYQTSDSEWGCRITKDAFGNYQIGNIVLVAITIIVLLCFLYMSFRMAGSFSRIARVAENRNYSLFLVISTLSVFALSVTNWIFGWVLLYERDDGNRTSSCKANREETGILLWIILVASLVLLVTMVLGVGGYGGTKSSVTSASSESLKDDFKESAGEAIV